MHVLALGASRNIGYLATRKLLEDNHSVTYFLRNPNCFENDAEIQKRIKEGRVHIVKGDATVREDIKKAFENTSSEGCSLDVILFSVGGTPSFSLTKGLVISPPNLCSASLLNVLACYPSDTSHQPKLIIISSIGITDAGHAALPFAVKPLFSYGLRSILVDKLVMERATFHAANWEWPQNDPEQMAEFLGADWPEQVKPAGFLKEVVVVRPSLLVDTPEKGVYRTSIEELKGAYTISRQDVAHFVAENVVKRWSQWKGKVVNITGK